MMGAMLVGGLMGLFVAAVGPAVAVAQTHGQASALVRKSLEAGARGECPKDLMAPPLRALCLRQMPGLGQRLATLGEITALEFLGVQTIPNAGPVEVYLVHFKNGQMAWAAHSGADGKLTLLWSHG
jgi:hypothetical protein